MTEPSGDRSKTGDSDVQSFLARDPSKTALLQAPDGSARLFLNSDELPNYYSDGKSFEELGVSDAKKVRFELNFRLHKDSIMALSHVGETLAPAIPSITYHSHVWWFWTYELGVKEVDNVLKAILTLKSIGPSMNPNRELPRGSIGRNFPDQKPPNVENPKLLINEAEYSLTAVTGDSEVKYFVDNFTTLENLKNMFSEENLFLTIKIIFEIPTDYFKIEDQIGFKADQHSIEKFVSKNVEEKVGEILQGKKIQDFDFILTFGDSNKNESTEFFINKYPIDMNLPYLGQLIRNKISPNNQVLIPASENRVIFPFLKNEDAEFFVNYIYLKKIILPQYGGFARIGRVFCMIAVKDQVLHLFNQWQKLIVEDLLKVKETGDSEKIVDASVKALIGIYSAPYGALPVAKRTAVSILADQLSIHEAKDINLIEKLQMNKEFASYNLEKFLPCVVKMKSLISAVKKEGII